MEEKWQKLEAWLAENAPQVLTPLNPPATEDEITAAETRIKMKFPPSVRASYLVHNGEQRKWGLFAAWQFLPLEQVVKTIDEMIRIEEQFKFGDFDATLMIPILQSGGGDFYYVEKSVNGKETKVIEWWHEQPSRDVKFQSFAAFFDDFLAKLENGEIIFHEEVGGLVQISDLKES